jgi:hypothetical protein
MERPSLPARVIMYDMAYCELCDMDREFCEHGLTERRRNAPTIARELLISPNGTAHFPGCPHKGDDPDYSRWACLDTPRAWERLGVTRQRDGTSGSPRPRDHLAGLREHHGVAGSGSSTWGAGGRWRRR